MLKYIISIQLNDQLNFLIPKIFICVEIINLGICFIFQYLQYQSVSFLR